LAKPLSTRCSPPTSWQNGTTVPLDESFELFIDIAVRGLEQRLASTL